MHQTADPVTRTALALLGSLDESQAELARGSLADPRLTEWSYLPGDRPGLSLEDLSSAQHALVFEMVEAAHSATGGELAIGAIEVERLRRELVTGAAPSGDRYWLRVL